MRIKRYEEFISEQTGHSLFMVFTSYINAVTRKFELPMVDDLYNGGKKYSEVIDYYVSNPKIENYLSNEFLKKLKRDIVVKTIQDKYVVSAFKKHLDIDLDTLLNNETAIFDFILNKNS